MAHIRFPFSEKKESKNCFICYDRFNPELDPAIHKVAQMLAEDLRSYGVNVSGYFPTQNPQVFVDALNNSQHVIVLASRNLADNVPDNNFKREFKQADNLKDQGKIRAIFNVLCEGSKSNLPFNYRGAFALAFTDINKEVSSGEEYLRCGKYADLFEKVMLKALGLSAQDKVQPVSRCVPK